jgi:DNA-binding GntR family transcriptional regulator
MSPAISLQGWGSNMGHFSTEKPPNPGSVPGRNQHQKSRKVACQKLYPVIQFDQRWRSGGASLKMGRKRINAQQHAYAHLKDRIMTGAFRARDVLSAEEIGKSLGISRMPVREAILQLEAEGLVIFGANRRPMIVALTPKEVVELFEIRIALECLAVERAAEALDAGLMQDLKDQLGRMDRAEADVKKWMQLHAEFHSMIYRAAEMPRLMDEIARLRESIIPYMNMYINVHKLPEMPGFEHRTLLDALERRDPLAARSALAEHIRSAATGVVYFLSGGSRSSSSAVQESIVFKEE